MIDNRVEGDNGSGGEENGGDCCILFVRYDMREQMYSVQFHVHAVLAIMLKSHPSYSK
jgi:hypothetical protein